MWTEKHMVGLWDHVTLNESHGDLVTIGDVAVDGNQTQMHCLQDNHESEM